jgi:uncharacterized protein with PIN domain
MEIRFHLDEHIAKAVAVGVRLHGVDVTTSSEMKLIGSVDSVQLTFATTHDRVLVTHDRDGHSDAKR